MFRRLSKAFSMTGSLNRFLNKLADLVQLNLLCVLCCLPVVTVGASIAALDAVLGRFLVNEEYSVGRDFFRSFRKSLGRATAIWMPSLLLYVAMALNLWICGTADFSGRLFVMGLTVCVIAITFFVDQYALILLGQKELKTTALIQTAFMLSVIGLPFSLLLLLLSLSPLIALWYSVIFFFRSMFVWILIGISLIQLTAVYSYSHILKKLPNICAGGTEE